MVLCFQCLGCSDAVKVMRVQNQLRLITRFKHWILTGDSGDNFWPGYQKLAFRESRLQFVHCIIQNQLLMVLCFQCLELTKPKDSLNTTSETVRIEDPKHWSWQGILKCLVCRPPRRGNSYTGPGSGWRHCRELTSSGFRVIAGNHDSHADRVSRDWVWPDHNESSITKDIVAAYNRS